MSIRSKDTSQKVQDRGWLDLLPPSMAPEMSLNQWTFASLKDDNQSQDSDQASNALKSLRREWRATGAERSLPNALALIEQFPSSIRTVQLGSQIAFEAGESELSYTLGLKALSMEETPTSLSIFIDACHSINRPRELAWAVNRMLELYPDELEKLRVRLERIGAIPSTVQDIRLPAMKVHMSTEEYALSERLRAGDPSQDNEILETIRNLPSPSTKFLLRIMNEFAVRSQPDLVQEFSEKVLAQENARASINILLEVTKTKIRVRLFQSAIELTSEAFESSLQIPIGRICLYASVKGHDFEKAEQVARSILEQNPTDGLSRKFLGTLAFGRGKFTESKAFLEDLIDRKRTPARVVFVQLICIALIESEFDRAIQIVNQMHQGEFSKLTKILIPLVREASSGKKAAVEPGLIMTNFLMQSTSKKERQYVRTMADVLGISLDLTEENSLNSDDIFNEDSLNLDELDLIDEDLTPLFSGPKNVGTSSIYGAVKNLKPIDRVARRVVRASND